LKKGRVKVDSKKPTLGTTAFNQGFSTPITLMYSPIAK